ncbi:MAG: cobalt transporter [Rhodospirillaceae bacterium]|nr:cobalt transporter [Rhodospirillaceae bacterium]
MFRRVFLTAILAGLLSGAVLSVVQEFTTTPLILFAEQFEDQVSIAKDGVQLAHGQVPVHPHDEAGRAAWAPEDGIERMSFTALTNIIFGVGFALLLVGLFALHGGPKSGREGTVWGVAGFTVFALAPALGLPAELPGSTAAALEARQVWWFFAAGGAGVGVALMVFARNWWMPVVGIVALALPHLVGAPHPEAYVSGPLPAELAGQFAASSLVVQAIFWAVMGWTAGKVWSRMDDATETA